MQFLFLMEGESEVSEHRNMGYARVSSTGQNLDRQINALKKYVPEKKHCHGQGQR